jgi:uncharacterized protein (DUF362 family)
VPGFAGQKADVSVAKGADYFKNTVKAVKQLGGMGKFVKKGAKVAILANPQRNNPGAFTKPPLLAAAIRMCKEAGAASVTCISWLPLVNWEGTGLKEAVEKEGAILKIANRKDETLFKPVPVPKGKSLKEARIMKEFFNHDLLISIPITKDHAGNKFTGTLKNLMGLNSPMSNRTFHKPKWKTDINDIRHLDQCIADLNTVITPALCIVDATEFIITNGPFGPGKLHKPQKVVAGVDRVAVDAYCSTLWGLKPQDIFTIAMAAGHGLGQIDLKKVKVIET